MNKNYFAILLGGILLCLTTVQADRVCTFALDGCPQSYHNQTLYVPTDVTAIDPVFNVCIPTIVVENAEGEISPPSIMFVIDNSNSMLGHSIDVPRDLSGSRFNVTRALIDTLLVKFPTAEVGLVVFRSHLVYDVSSSDPLIKAVPGGDQSKGYVPLVQLNSTLANNMTGAQYLKQKLTTREVQVTPDGGGSLTAVTLDADKSLSGGTNINGPFDAVRDAMQYATYGKESQFVIFLSDGEANSPSRNTDEYVEGVNMPTTFTVFFTPGATGVAPRNIIALTENIKANGYSLTNPNSSLWTIQTDFDKLMSLMMKSVIQPLFNTIKQRPTQLTVNGKTYLPENSTSTSFYLTDNYTLNKSVTPFNISINYKVNSSSADIPISDTTMQISLKVERTDSRPMSKGVLLNCKDTIYYTVNVKTLEGVATELGPKGGTIEVSRDNTNGAVTVYYSIGGSAMNGKDYKTITDSVYFADGIKTAMVSIMPLPDSIVEGDETVAISLQEKRPGKVIRYYVGTNSSAELVIKDHVIEKPDSVFVGVTPNPYSFKAGMENVELLQQMFGKVVPDNSTGALIVLTSKRKLIKIPETNFYGSGIIYDAVGNVVAEVDLQASPYDSTLYGVIWDGTNKNRRRVGVGAYLLRLKVESTTGKKFELNEKIGIVP